MSIATNNTESAVNMNQSRMTPSSMRAPDRAWVHPCFIACLLRIGGIGVPTTGLSAAGGGGEVPPPPHPPRQEKGPLRFFNFPPFPPRPFSFFSSNKKRTPRAPLPP